MNHQDHAIEFSLIRKTTEDLFIDIPKIMISKEFIANKHSSPTLISTLIANNLEIILDMINIKNEENFYILIQYTELTSSN